MPDREMTPERALIILDRLNTDEKIEVDRGELKEAVAVAKDAIRKNKIPQRGKRDAFLPNLLWCDCGKEMYITERFCSRCGQALTQL